MQHFDVMIVGAGPAGSSAAVALARKGYSVALLDKEKFPRPKLCGDFVNPVNWPLLREFGVEREILSRPHKKIATFRVTSYSGAEAEVSFPRRNGESVFGLGLSRSDLDHALVKKAGSEGAEIFQGARLKELSRKSQRWLLAVDRGGAIDDLGATILIGADGRNSYIAHRLGMAGAKVGQQRSIGVQLRLERAGIADGKVEIHLFPGGYAGIVGLGGDTVNLCCAVERDRLPRHRPPRLLLDSCLPRNPWLKEILHGDRGGAMRATYPVYFPPRRAHGDAVVLVGDAARVSEPVTGEGIYFALKSGVLAAKTIHLAFQKSDFSAASLKRYVGECQEEFYRRQRTNSLIRLLVYHPALLSPFIRFSARSRRILNAIVKSICLP